MKDSYWIKKAKNIPTYPKLTKETDANTVIVGAGLTGLTTAYYLSLAMDDMIVIEADRVGYGASGRNNGKVTSQHGLLYRKLMENYDAYYARMYYHANEEALHSIEEIIREHQIDCDFRRCDAMIYTDDSTSVAQLQDEYQAYLDLHIPCDYVDKKDVPFPMEAGLIMHYQAAFDPYAYALGLANIISENGNAIYEQSPLTDIQEEADGTYTLYVNDVKIHATNVVFATQFPFIDRGKFYFARMYCEQETIAYAPYEKDGIMAVNIDEELHSYHTFDHQVFIGGNKHKSGQTIKTKEDAFIKDAIETFKLKDVPQCWTSSDYVSFDHIPFIGKLDKHNDHVLFASGFSKWGNTTSNIAGKLLCAYLLHLRPSYRMLYSPQRYNDIFSLPFVKENMNVAYEFIKSKFKSADDDYPLINQGKMVQIDDHIYGVYRDEHEELFIVDITCPHLGCVCTWNDLDKTWDCPCHGSRFSYKGDVIKGPAAYSLQPYGTGLNKIDPHLSE